MIISAYNGKDVIEYYNVKEIKVAPVNDDCINIVLYYSDDKVENIECVYFYVKDNITIGG